MSELTAIPVALPAGTIFTGYTLGAAYDEMFERRTGRGRTTKRCYRRLADADAGEFRRRKAHDRSVHAPGRRRLHRLSAGRRHRACLADGPGAAHHSGRRMARIEQGLVQRLPR